METLSKAYIAELPNYYSGKVRENYFLDNGIRITIATDRLSAFDRNIACVPHKGQILNQMTKYWFKNTSDICKNYAIDYPDPNVLVGEQLKMIPIELIVRGYLSGNTNTSILTLYKKGDRIIYGHRLPDGMSKNQKLPQPIITPTTKSAKNDHDLPISAHEIIQQGILTKKQWDIISNYSLSLFNRGCKIAADSGLILADSKYEFGLNKSNEIILADEIHTPDSSRYWTIEGYKQSIIDGIMPSGLDKDIIRNWILKRCYPYKDKIPKIPNELILDVSKAYITAYEKITKSKFIFNNNDCSILQRIRNNLCKYYV
ncbi:phosphoribosylaminoimidazolesuccinocarboxamide synthase [Candidatus Liberibacter americanus]|uniref:Phosphoribosylaminoimidazole-succinocarboxamide synthase n=1 Tax=Candidatus Liberibacter americanus str. Sao Paulo TaxID=1261131 RepID=U6B8N5_9HYPH|nr:phosphoribosylaminoimidazolesuccinocarboxamide synthase [Candidatus Liberibacter americanus]AHA28201.1 Phosphoribosylaminoimidazole-succinocarboxamide synthase [Candidatus Liberibacter americanus str. Sao Paulo]EMS36285.1 phosphoribosylaminoimidazole-succinocarboxamide synthase [Candidatus Liberibacter americanus PW_SP]